MLRLAAWTALVLCLVTNSQAKAQDDAFGEHTPSQNVAAHVAQNEMQVKSTKLKRLFEEIADHELAFTRWVDQEDLEQTRTLIAKNQKIIESLRVESEKTRDQISHLAKMIPQG